MSPRRVLWASLRVIAVLVVLAALAGKLALDRYETAVVAPLTHLPGNLTVTIPKGTGTAAVAALLEREGVLPQPLVFRLEVRRRELDRQLKAGEYAIGPGDSIASLIDRLVRGDTTRYAVTLIEGQTFREALATLMAHPQLVRPKDLDLSASAESLARHFELPFPHAEGSLYPDTYQFEARTPLATVVVRARDRLRAVLAEVWEGRADDLPLKTPYEALILASIIEKETGVAAERPEIAGVFVRRLRKGMKLQTDPTVIYGLGEAFDGNLRKKDLTTDTPWNSYTRAGLPPTPIALVGRAALEAAVHPAQGNALYFVARGDGTHQFSASYREHQQAVRTYQLRR